MVADPVAETLNKAADEIDRRGWCQGKWETDDGRVCVRQAIGYASSEALLRREARYRLAAYLGMAPLGIMAWNDARGRTQAEVVRALRGAATQKG